MLEYIPPTRQSSHSLRVTKEGVLEEKGYVCNKLFSFMDEEFHPLNLPVVASSLYDHDEDSIAVLGKDNLVYYIGSGKSWTALPLIQSPIICLRVCGYISVVTAIGIAYEWNYKSNEWDVNNTPTPILYICSNYLSTMALTMCGKVYIKGFYYGRHLGIPQTSVFAKDYIHVPIPEEEEIVELSYGVREYGSVFCRVVTVSGVIWEAGETVKESKGWYRV